MSYRDDLTALSARHTALEQEVAQKKRELAQAAAALAEARHRASLPVVDNLRIASPCSVQWSQMTGDDRTRTCADCNTRVYNLSGMTRDEAHALLKAREGRICVRYYERHDGTILLADCEVGVRRRRGRNALALTAALVAATVPIVIWHASRTKRSDPAPLPQPVSTRANMSPQPPPMGDAMNAMGGAMGGGNRARNTAARARREAEAARPKAQSSQRIREVAGGLPAHAVDDPFTVQPKPTKRAHVVITK
jgi:hypothetical protein